MSDYTATAQRMEGGWWMIQCDQHPGALSQVRRLDQAAAEHQEAIAFVTGEPVEHVRVTITPVLDLAVRDEIATVTELVEVAARASGEVAARRAALARRLHEQGLTVRDIGAVMGVSYQRAQQLMTTASPTRTRKTG